MSIKTLFYVAFGTFALSSSALGDQYPVSGVWAALDPSQPKLTAQSCTSYQRNRKNVTGNVIVFQGTQKVEFNGGYLEEETTTNVSVKKIGPNEFQITDRFYDDGEGGTKSGYKNLTYRMIVNDKRLSISVGKYQAAQYVACSMNDAPKTVRFGQPKCQHSLQGCKYLPGLC